MPRAKKDWFTPGPRGAELLPLAVRSVTPIDAPESPSVLIEISHGAVEISLFDGERSSGPVRVRHDLASMLASRLYAAADTARGAPNGVHFTGGRS